MKARLFKPARRATQSAMSETCGWVLDVPPMEVKELDPLLGWCGSTDTNQQLRLNFQTKEAALAYAKSVGIEVLIVAPQDRKVNIRSGGYGENFSTNRRTTWTH